MTGTANTDNSMDLGMVDGTQYHSRPNPHNAGICGQCIRAGTVDTVLVVPLFGFGTTWHCTLGGAGRLQTRCTQGSMPDFPSMAEFASRHAPRHGYRLPGHGLENGYTQLRRHSLPLWTGPLPGAVCLAARGQQCRQGRGHRQGVLQVIRVFAAKWPRSKPPSDTTYNVATRGGLCIPV